MCRGQEVPSSQAMMGTSDAVLLLEQKVLLGSPGGCILLLTLAHPACLAMPRSLAQPHAEECSRTAICSVPSLSHHPKRIPVPPPRLEGCCCPLLTLLVQASIVSLLTGGSDLFQSLPASSLTLSKQSFTLQPKNIL